VLASASGLCGAVAVGDRDGSLLLYPSHYALGNGAIAALILHRRRSIRPDPEPVEIPLAG
jgi:hypothetical protein